MDSPAAEPVLDATFDQRVRAVTRQTSALNPPSPVTGRAEVQGTFKQTVRCQFILAQASTAGERKLKRPTRHHGHEEVARCVELLPISRRGKSVLGRADVLESGVAPFRN